MYKISPEEKKKVSIEATSDEFNDFHKLILDDRKEDLKFFRTYATYTLYWRIVE